MINEILSMAGLRDMGDDNAAALLLVRRNADDYDGADEAVFEEWLAADLGHPEAWARACEVCARFDEPENNPLLSQMRDALREDALPNDSRERPKLDS